MRECAHGTLGGHAYLGGGGGGGGYDFRNELVQKWPHFTRHCRVSYSTSNDTTCQFSSLCKKPNNHKLYTIALFCTPQGLKGTLKLPGVSSPKTTLNTLHIGVLRHGALL